MTKREELVGALRGQTLLGALVMWTLAELRVERQELFAFLSSLGLGPAAPTKPSTVSIARQAATAAAAGHREYLVREVMTDHEKVVWAVVRERRDAKEVVLEHQQETRVAVFRRNGQIVLEDEDHQVAQAFERQYLVRRDYALTADVSAAIIRALTGTEKDPMLAGLRLAGRGGAYFVAAQHVPAVRAMAGWLEEKGGANTVVTVLEVGAHGDNPRQTGRCADLALRARLEEIQQEIRTFVLDMRAKDATSTVSDTVIATRLRRYDVLASQVQLYGDILGDMRADLEAEIGEARAAVLGINDTLDADFGEDEDE